MDLYALHAESARALASRVLFDRCEAEDIVQDVFLTLWRRPEQYDPERGTGRAWLLTSVRNRSLDHLRRRRCGRRREDVADLAERLADPHATDGFEELEAEARNARLWQFVDALPPTQADLIRRAYVSGQTHQEIASPPIEIVELEAGDLDRSQPQPGKQHQHRSIPRAVKRRAIAAREQRFNVGLRHRRRDRRLPPPCDPGHGLRQRPAREPADVQEPQQRPQLRDLSLRRPE